MSTLSPTSINWNPLDFTQLAIDTIVTLAVVIPFAIALIVFLCCCIPNIEIPIPEEEPLIPPEPYVEKLKSALESRKSYKIFTSDGILEVSFTFYGENELRWELYNVKMPTKKYKLNFKDIIEVRSGKGTENFNIHTKVKIPEDRCFSLITKKFTLDIVAETWQERDLMVKGFEKLTSGSSSLDIGSMGFGTFDSTEPSVSITVTEPLEEPSAAEPSEESSAPVAVEEPSASVDGKEVAIPEPSTSESDTVKEPSTSTTVAAKLP